LQESLHVRDVLEFPGLGIVGIWSEVIESVVAIAIIIMGALVLREKPEALTKPA
jgi:hypothetical protein